MVKKIVTMEKNILKYLIKTSEKYPNKFYIKTDKLEEGLTYSDFLLKTKQLATFLINNGYHKQPILVNSRQNPETIILFYAILMSGNYYVPVAYDMPLERKRAIAQIIYSDFDLEKRISVEFSSENGFCVYNFDLDYQQNNCKQILSCDINESLINDYVNSINPNDPMNIIFTSGSTGVPKGIIKTHGNMISFIEAFASNFNLDENAIFGNQTPFYFDASAKDIYVAVKIGATIQLISKEKFSFPAILIDFLNKTKINTISWVPSALSIVAQFKAFSIMKPLYLKKVFFVGEIMPIKYLNYWKSNLENVSFYNLYGSSETAGIVCYYEIKDILDECDKIPIGRPLSNANIYLINDNNELCKNGEHGEICISGEMLAKGYYKNLSLTQKCFVQNPLNDKYMEIIYKTGDLGYYDENGELIYSGRRDF